MNDYIYAEMIKDFIDSHSITTQDFCILCKIDFETLDKIFNNRIDIEFGVLVRISIMMEIGVQELIKPKERKPRPGWGEVSC